jgi:hypothetical protein
MRIVLGFHEHTHPKPLTGFIWTKFGDDAGEQIGGILARKEAERQAGSFWWGIGSSIDRAKLTVALRAAGGTVPVVFSAQISPPKRCGFGGMTLWTQWVDSTGTHEVPHHALVISKGRATRYYALVCQAERSIAALYDLPFDEQLFLNYPDGARPGNSQNTAFLAGTPEGNHSHGRYRRGFLATLVYPWFVTLAGPQLLTAEKQNLVAGWRGGDYAVLVRRIRG